MVYRTSNTSLSMVVARPRDRPNSVVVSSHVGTAALKLNVINPSRQSILSRNGYYSFHENSQFQSTRAATHEVNAVLHTQSLIEVSSHAAARRQMHATRLDTGFHRITRQLCYNKPVPQSIR
ncbi:hypothetical protein AcW1_005144 [Taiwanofungus camphoratus]|nr:hypothetical protein AcW1_005144 [Antrodia cinnamomea]